MEAKIIRVRPDASGAEIILRAEGQELERQIKRTGSRTAELIIQDKRFITPEQRKKIYALFGDISYFTGYSPDETKSEMKRLYVAKTGKEPFSLADCPIETARQFINILLDYALYNGFPLEERGLERTDDIYGYLVSCLHHKKCCICGRKADIHHIDAIGMGNNRDVFDDSNNEVMALCREHHVMAHAKGREVFCRMYHVFGIRRGDVEEGYTRIFD